MAMAMGTGRWPLQDAANQFPVQQLARNLWVPLNALHDGRMLRLLPFPFLFSFQWPLPKVGDKTTESMDPQFGANGSKYSK